MKHDLLHVFKRPIHLDINNKNKVQTQNFQKSIYFYGHAIFYFFYFKLIFDINILKLLKNNRNNI
jgi:hypothetical protein